MRRPRICLGRVLWPALLPVASVQWHTRCIAPTTPCLSWRFGTAGPLFFALWPVPPSGLDSCAGDPLWSMSRSGLGQKQTFLEFCAMSALPPKADMDQLGCDVRFVSKADIAVPRL